MASPTQESLRRYNYLFGETEAAYHDACLKLGCSDSAMKILYAVCDNGGSCPLRTIRRCSGLSKQTMNSSIRKLEAEGMLYLESAGGREKSACLTERGRAAAEQTAMRILHIEEDIFSCWPREDVEAYLRLTEKFLNDFKERSARLERKESYAHPIL